MRAYSLDLRTHLVQAVRSGISKAEAADVFGVSVRTVDRYLKQLAESGALAAKPIPGRPRQISREQDAQLAAQLRAHPDVTLTQHCQLWQQAQGVRVSPATMSRAIQRLGWTWKKSRWWPPSGTRLSGPPGGSRSPTSIPPDSSSLTNRARISP
ncbi:MAG: helix-turn-helix domain-containing protein [Gemmatimonadales bacterium]